MGVEYRHSLVGIGDVVDGFDTLRAIHQALHELGIEAEPTAFDIGEGKCDELGRGLEAASGHSNVMLRYGRLVGAVAARLMGPSAFDSPDDERYLADLAVLAGDEYRVYSGEEGCDCPMAEEGQDLARVSFEWCPNGQRPSTKPFSEAPVGFDGLFRTCVAFDCGKDMPAFVMDGPIKMPTSVVRRIEAALGRAVIELGEVY